MRQSVRKLARTIYSGEKGLTLIELLIVIAILGIIAAVIIPNIAGFLISGQLAAANTEAENVKTGALGYFGEYNTWPDDSSVLIPQYLAGTTKAVYTIDDYGWLVSVSNSTWPSEIEFSCSANGTTGHHGKWIRTGSNCT